MTQPDASIERQLRELEESHLRSDVRSSSESMQASCRKGTISSCAPLGLDVTFRRAEPSDALCISVLGMQVFLDTYATDGIRPSVAREVTESLSPEVVAKLLVQPASLFIVAEMKGHMVGFAQLTAEAEHELVPFARPAELNRLYVQEPFTGRGIGKALLAQAEAASLAAGAPAVWLTVWAGNARALGFYPSQGYKEAGSTLFTFHDEQYETRLFVKALPLDVAPRAEAAKNG